MRRRLGTVLVAALVAVATVSAAGCASTTTADRASTSAPTPSSDPATLGPTGGSSSSPAPSAGSTRERLAVLGVDDRPSPAGAYRRDDWPHWDDVDGNGCDARQDALVRWSRTPVAMDPARRCKVVAGTWTSPYDGLPAASPAEVEVDHLVPLAEAFRSGGWRWDAPQRRRFANDPAELVPTSSPSNRSKGDDTPDQWRPPRRQAWCAYADRYVTVKQTYALTVTTEERDALGQMLDTCGPESDQWP